MTSFAALRAERQEAWLHQAESDLALARLARDHGYLAQACFLASQAAEKALISAVLELGEEPTHTHVLPDLTAALTRLGLDVSSLEQLPLRRLSRMAITSRYPMDATPPSELFDLQETDQALETAAAVIQHLRALDQA